MRTLKVGVLDHLGGGNLGDDATLDSIMQNIERRWPGAEIVGFSMSPSDTQTRHGITCYPIRRETWDINYKPGDVGVTLTSKVKGAIAKHRFLLRFLEIVNAQVIGIPRTLLSEIRFLVKSLRTIRQFDLLIIGGGGQLLDSWGGPWRFPYTIFKWIVLAKISNAKCYIVNVGAGPLRRPLSKYFVKYSLALADYSSFRDDNSRTLVKQLGFSKPGEVFPDCVYSLDMSTLNVCCNGRRGESIVGISPMAYCDPRRYWEGDHKKYSDFIQNLALFGSQLIQDQHRLRIFSTDISFDAEAIEDLTFALKRSSSVASPEWIRQDTVAGIHDLLSQMSEVDYVVTCRFHGVVFAHLLNKPVLAISHHPKVSTLMADFGLSEYCVDIRAIDPDSLAALFRRMADNQKDIKTRMAAQVKCRRDILDKQFDELFSRTSPSWID